MAVDDDEKIEPYKPAAGGWEAVVSSARHVAASGQPVRAARTVKRVNQTDGFDCPGCAWGDPLPASSFEFCENGVKAVAWEATAGRLSREFLAAHSLADLRRMDGHFLESQGRLVEPLIYNSSADRLEPTDWETAFALIAEQLNSLAGPDEAAFYTSGRTSNEAAFLYQLFARMYGTNNLPDCSNMCHEASGVALKEAIGTGKGTVRLEDFEQADAIFVFGQNPGTNHPRMLGELRRAAKRGARTVTFNPVRERGLEKFADPKSAGDMITGGTRISHCYFQIRVGGDMAAAKGIMKHLLSAEAERAAGDPAVLDHEFIAAHTTGFAELRRDIEATPWAEIEARSGLSKDDLARAAEIYRTSERVIFTWAMGLTQHQYAVETIQSLLNLLLLRGNMGRPGAGACPVRGHSNVQGDRTMGITPFPETGFLNHLEAEFGITVPRRPGLRTVETIAAMAAGRIKVFISLGGNFAAATPDTEVVERALRGCRLTVNIATKLNRSHIVPGKQALVLPALGRTEFDEQTAGRQKVTVEDSMSMVHASGGINPPAAETIKSEVAIVAGMAAATLSDRPVNWEGLAADYDRIRDHIARVVPGFADFNRRVAVPGGFYLGNPAAERRWLTPDKKARFMAHPLPGERATGDGDEPIFTLMTFRAHDQYNTTVYRRDDRYRGIKNERRVLFISPRDLGRLGLAGDERVDIVSIDETGEERCAADFRLVPYSIPEGNVAAYYPETNVLVPLARIDEKSQTPSSKSVPVRLRRARGDAAEDA